MAEDSNWGEDTLKQKILKEYYKVKEMSPKEKFNYYMSYYFVLTLVIVTVTVCTVLIVKKVFFDKNEKIIAGTSLNVEFKNEGYDYINEGFTEYFKNNNENVSKDAKASLGNGVMMKFNDNNEPLDSEYQDVMSFNTLLMGGEEDYILVGEDAIQYFGNQKYYKDLSEIVDAEFIEENKDKIVYFDSGETGNAIPSGINITDTELVRDMVYTKEDIYLFFIEGSSHEKNDKMFLDYILKQ